MKKIQTLKYYGLALAALLLGGASLSFAAATPDVTLQSFDVNASGVGINWGSSTFIWDATEGNPAGSLKVTGVFGGNDTPFMPYICYNGGNPWYNAGTFDFSLYKSVDFDIKYDTTSDITIAEFNDLSTWNTTMTNKNGSFIMQSWAGSGYLSGSIVGMDVNLCGPGPTQVGTLLTNMPMPAAAAFGWTHVSVPIDPTKSGLAGMSGITIHKWINQNWGIASNAQARVWIDNIVLVGTAGPPPPPTLSAPTTKATPGLNVFASTAGLYDRQSAVLRQTSGLSWVGQATAGNPVTYSFTIAGYPQSVNCEAYMFLIPNPAYLDAAPDWNETNCAIAYIQGSSTSATMRFRYKVGEPGNQLMYGGAAPYTNAPGSWDGVTPNYLESGDLGSVTNTSVLGTWTIKFTSDTAVTLISPSGNSSSFTFPAYNAGKFAELGTPGFYIYLGMQANNVDALNQAVVYSHFAVSNTATPFSENFLADTVLDTTNTWNTSAASGSKGVLIVPATAAYWLHWTLPDTGFSLEISPTLTNPLAWTMPSIGPVLGMVSLRSQLVDSSELPVGGTAFFRLIKRTFTKLQILLPGETAAPNTISGKTGTPITQANNTPFDVIVNAVDATWNMVNSAADTIGLTDPADANFLVLNTPANLALSGGTATFSVDFLGSGSSTITATNLTNGTITSDTSSTVNYP